MGLEVARLILSHGKPWPRGLRDPGLQAQFLRIERPPPGADRGWLRQGDRGGPSGRGGGQHLQRDGPRRCQMPEHRAAGEGGQSRFVCGGHRLLCSAQAEGNRGHRRRGPRPWRSRKIQPGRSPGIPTRPGGIRRRRGCGGARGLARSMPSTRSEQRGPHAQFPQGAGRM